MRFFPLNLYLGLFLAGNLILAGWGLSAAPAPEELAEAQTRRMVEVAGLRPEQAAQVNSIYLKYAPKIRQAELDGESQDTINRLLYQQNQELKKVLTPNQLRIYQRSRVK